MQPPRTCCLCGKGFIDAPALWKHCDDEHHSWAEAVKRMLWEAEQLEAMPLLPPDKRRIIQSCARKVIIVYSIRTRLTVLFATTLTSTKDTLSLIHI